MRKKIFLLDDNTAAFERSIEQLETRYEVMRCKDIISAIRRIQIRKYDCIIIDLMMPTRGLDVKDEFKAGFNFYLEQVKLHQPAVPVLFWSNLTDASFIQFKDSHPEDCALLHFLHKTEDIYDLESMITEILNDDEKN